VPPSVFAFALPVALVCTSATALAVEADRSACREQESNRGHDADISEVICVARRLFQSRIRSKPDQEPVEMTVGAPPMTSDDTDTPGPGNLEVNTVLAAGLSSERQTYAAPLLDINFGIGERLQLKFEVPFVIDRTSPAAGPNHADHGVGDSIAGVKYRFYDDDASGLSLGVYPQVQFHTPAAPRAVSEGGTTFILPLLLTGEFPRASITVNLGVEKSTGAEGVDFFASFGAGTRLSPRVALMAEIAAQDLGHPHRLLVFLDLGLKVKLGHQQSIMGAVGYDVRAPDDQAASSHVTVAYQRLFGH
jgi:hypothetical protein